MSSNIDNTPDVDPEQLQKGLKEALVAREVAQQHLEEDAKAPGVIEKYGWYPFVGLSLTALIGKEIVVLSPANLLGTYTLVGLGAIWLLAGETIKKTATEEAEQDEKTQKDMMDVVVELNKAEIAVWKTKGLEADLLEQYRNESVTVNAKWSAAQVLKARHAYRAETLARLKEVVNREQTELAQAQAKLVTDAIAYVRAKFSKRDAKTDQEAFEFALLGLAAPAGYRAPKTKDPVRNAFLEFFKSKGKK